MDPHDSLDSVSPPPWGWSICGLGRASRARLAAFDALSQAVPRYRYSRRSGAGNAPFETILRDPDTHCVAICTENADHAGRVEACLRAGKHVLVEYPLAPTGRQAASLLALAHDQGRILHVGLIGLLTAQHGAVADALATEQVYGIELSLQGGFTGWIAEEARAGHYGQLALSRLHSLWDWVGPLRLHRAECARRADGYRLEVELRDKAGRLHRLVEQRGTTLKRSKSVRLKDPRGAAVPLSEVHAPTQVFLQDTAHVHARIQGASPRVADETIVAVASLADAVSLRVGTPC